MPPTRAAEDLEALIARIPKGCPSTTPTIQCCCGHTDCAYLKHNGSALEDLEKNVHTAAQLGQVRWHSFVLFVPPLVNFKEIIVVQTTL